MGRTKASQGPEIDWESRVVYKYGFERLCSAVVAQAAKDKAWWFFESPAIRVYLSDRIDPLALERQIKDNYNKFGRWSAVDTKAVPWSGRLEGEEEL
jgi:hypothetical protein